MNIILGKENAEVVDDRYVVLELDQIWIDGTDKPITAYCLVDNMQLADALTMDQFRDLHNNLMKNYRLQNWKYCQDALEHLTGKWNGQLDSFYSDLGARIEKYKNTSLPDDWTGIIDRRADAVDIVG